MEGSSSSSSESELPFPVFSNPNPDSDFYSSSSSSKKKKKKKRAQKQRSFGPAMLENDEWRWKRGGEVMLEGYVEAAEGGRDGGLVGGDGAVGRTKSLTDEDLEELKGCLDLGFGFNYEEIPELCSTLPALELCYSMSQRFLDEQQQQQQQQGKQGKSVEASGEAAESSAPHTVAHTTPIANWKISSPGDNPDDVKARLKYWAQAVACTVKLCN
ncbi:uncharacterized protein LOC120270585 [Dioscorea cayenensis subsp. rotundata]|uniref:Uncharacterized protein LOC120270585 n=1 Tax=Dioscorea cayennensis subsp. rotundata TaxID=55577 RepID=A0AB40C4U6_DIOCR|nr:uncharacterized protein LOC120270585 [Dioscorea cayenensis subsp. rotundata]